MLVFAKGVHFTINFFFVWINHEKICFATKKFRSFNYKLKLAKLKENRYLRLFYVKIQRPAKYKVISFHKISTDFLRKIQVPLSIQHNKMDSLVTFNIFKREIPFHVETVVILTRENFISQQDRTGFIYDMRELYIPSGTIIKKAHVSVNNEL